MNRVLPPALADVIEASSLQLAENPRGFDAIVVGAGAAGGMAAMRLTEAGMRVLVLDAGWRAPIWRAPLRRLTAGVVEGVANPRLQSLLPPKMIQLGRRALRLAGRYHQAVQTKCFAWELAPEAFVDDRECPYINEPESRFDWFRTRQIGGRMTVPGHGRQYYRLGDEDLRPGDGRSPAWPLAKGELDPWYDLVERRLGLSGGAEACDWIPQSRLANQLAPNAAESEAVGRVKGRWTMAATPILGRWAPPLDGLGAAAATGLLACRTGAIVHEVVVDGQGNVGGVRWHDRAEGGLRTARAPVVFLCASALESTRILMCSGVGARSDALGRYLMDHVVVSGDGAAGPLPNEPVPYEPGRCLYLPRFDLRAGRASEGAGFGVQIYRWSTQPGKSYFNAVSFAEMAPRAENRIVLDNTRRDRWGVPVLRIECRHSEAELAIARDQAAALRELGEMFGVAFQRLDAGPAAPGTAMHECGTARMGETPAESVLDPHNQCWDAKGLYVTDAAAFPSQGAQNPTLTILALTARACAHAVQERHLAGAGARQPSKARASAAPYP